MQQKPGKPEDLPMPTVQAENTMTQLQRLLQSRDQFEKARTPGEALIPYFLAAVEVCWIDALLIGLAGVGFLHTGTALLPFWGPLLLFWSALWLFQRLLLQEATSTNDTDSTDVEQKRSGSPVSPGLLIGVLLFLSIGLIWLRVYAGTFFLFDPRWFLIFLNDLFALNDRFFQVLTILLLAGYLCWRATRLAQIYIGPAYVRRQMWIGLLCLTLAIFLRSGQTSTRGNGDDLVLVLLIPVFFYCVLSAHTLARMVFMRRSHPFGLEDNIAVQERALLNIVGGVGVLLLASTLLGGLFFSTSFFLALQPAWRVFSIAYTWLVSEISLLLAWLLQPLFALASLLSTHASGQHHAPQPPATPKGKPPHPLLASTTGVAYASGFILPALLLLGLILLLTHALRRRRRLSIARNRLSNETHESVWSWSLFWKQLKAFLGSFFRRKGSDSSGNDARQVDDLPGEPAARTVRALYRALLAKAATLGYARRRYETPQEFQQRLNQAQASHSEPQISQITTAYTLTRYAGTTPDEYELARLQHAWAELEQKWT